jgi:ABC-type hemin transport system substrate-binding protein
MVFILCGCSNYTDKEVQQTGDLRIVSLSPGITNTLIDAGYTDFIVGRSAFCFHANQDIPVVGDLLNIDYERLLRLSPTHVFIQKTAAGADNHLVNVSAKMDVVLCVWPLDTIADIQNMFSDITELLGGERLQLSIQPSQKQAIPQSVLVVTQGLKGSAGLSFGKNTYVDDLLQMMGVTNALERDGWISLSLEDIGRLNPGTIIVLSDSDIPDSSLKWLYSLGVSVIPFVHEHALVPSSYVDDLALEFQKVVGGI